MSKIKAVFAMVLALCSLGCGFGMIYLDFRYQALQQLSHVTNTPLWALYCLPLVSLVVAVSYVFVGTTEPLPLPNRRRPNPRPN